MQTFDERNQNATELDDQQLEQVSGGFSFSNIRKSTSNPLGNFEIQDLMSRFNEAQTLASSVQKKEDDTTNAIIGKVG